tara:strand:- start:364 stop:555 length:192 start_codon:yes stop_codon:yes gene_type:complete
MKIKKGDNFVCIKTVIMIPDEEIAYKKGVVYFSDKKNCITSENLNKNHSASGKWAKKHFVKLK